MRRRWLAGMIGAACLAVVAPATPRAAGAVGPTPEPGAGGPRAYILVDVGSGAVLRARAPHEPVAVAAAVKLMTALTALQRIRSEDRVATTPRAADAPAPRLGMREGTTWALEDLVQATLLSSANDAAYALAEGAAGSLEQFAAEMERVGTLIGLQDSTFGDAAGLDDETTFTGPTSMSAYDLAVVGANVLAAPELAETVQLLDYRVKTPDGVETALREGTNNGFLESYAGANGLVTGSSLAAGNVLVASAARDGRTLVAVVLNAEDPIAFAAGLLDDGFATARDAEGTGEAIPEARLTTLEGRLIAIIGVPRPLGAPTIGIGPSGPGAPISDAPAPTTTPRPAAGDDGGGDGGFPLLRVLALLVAAGLVVGFALRQRAVQRERVRRQVRERALAHAAKRGTLDVLDPDEAAEPPDIRIVR